MTPHTPAVNAAGELLPEQPKSGHSTACSGLPSTEDTPTPRFQWCCNEKGCGPCDLKRIEFEYSREETLDGKLLASRTTPLLVSACCGGSVYMWDHLTGEEVGIQEAR